MFEFPLQPRVTLVWWWSLLARPPMLTVLSMLSFPRRLAISSRPTITSRLHVPSSLPVVSSRITPTHRRLPSFQGVSFGSLVAPTTGSSRHPLTPICASTATFLFGNGAMRFCDGATRVRRCESSRVQCKDCDTKEEDEYIMHSESFVQRYRAECLASDEVDTRCDGSDDKRALKCEVDLGSRRLT